MDSFTIEVKGKIYSCKSEREKVGQLFKQHVYVEGFGGMDDEKLYYIDEVKAGLMRVNAKSIARILVANDA